MISHSTDGQHRRPADRGSIAADDLFGQPYHLHMCAAALVSVKKARRVSFGLEHAALHQMRQNAKHSPQTGHTPLIGKKDRLYRFEAMLQPTGRKNGQAPRTGHTPPGNLNVLRTFTLTTNRFKRACYVGARRFGGTFLGGEF